MGVCLIIGVILACFLGLYVILELHYFLRMALVVILARVCKKKVHILQETSISGICITTDIDTLVTHMNNARFLRELDFARVDFYERTGLYRTIRKKGGSVALGASTIRYRRFIRLFNRYVITSKIIFWDSQSIFMEHRFVNPNDKFVNAIIHTRTRLLNCNAEDIMQEMANTKGDVENGEKMAIPDMPPEVAKWMESNAISSATLRQNC